MFAKTFMHSRFQNVEYDSSCLSDSVNILPFVNCLFCTVTLSFRNSKYISIKIEGTIIDNFDGLHFL